VFLACVGAGGGFQVEGSGFEGGGEKVDSFSDMVMGGVVARVEGGLEM
jgi:hypothetical protein